MSGSVVLITGAATGIGNLTARALATAGYTVFASMRSPEDRNSHRAEELLTFARQNKLDLRIVELDVQSQGSADAAVESILAAVGQLDIVVHNAGHLAVGYVETFTAEDLAHLFDVNTFGLQRVNRAALPHMRERRRGTLLYVGSTTTVVVPPFLGPYVASKFAFDALAQTTAYEVGQLGIESSIVMPGAFTEGTEHFPNASRGRDTNAALGYSSLNWMVARNEEATQSLFDPHSNANPIAVADEITRILNLPFGEKPFRSVVDFTPSDVESVNKAARREQESFLSRMGYEALLTVKS